MLGGGCFWCLDAVYQQTTGVKSVVSGYTGGSGKPDYESVASGRTGHAEVVAVTFDEEIVPPDVVLGLFFVSHDPTSLNRQGYDVGTQYRSSMFYADDLDKADFLAARDAAAADWPNPIVTEIEPLGEFYPGEDVPPEFLRRTSVRRLLPGHHQPQARQGPEALRGMAELRPTPAR